MKHQAPETFVIAPLAIFQVRCETMALLVSAGELDLHEGVDLLRDEADANGFDTDEAQAIMNQAFRPAAQAPRPVLNQPAKRDYRLVAANGVASPAELQRAYDDAIRHRDEHGAPQVTYEALVCAYREARQRGNTKAFEEPANKERLGRLSPKQRADLTTFIKRCEQQP